MGIREYISQKCPGLLDSLNDRQEVCESFSKLYISFIVVRLDSFHQVKYIIFKAVAFLLNLHSIVSLIQVIQDPSSLNSSQADDTFYLLGAQTSYEPPNVVDNIKATNNGTEYQTFSQG